MVALKIFDVLIQAPHLWTVHILTDRNRHVIPFFDTQSTSLLVVYWVLVLNQMLGVGTPTFTVAGSALKYKANLYNCYELRHLLSRANAIYFKQETGTLRVTTMCTVPITGSSRLFGCTYNCTEFVRINTDVLAYSMNECAVSEDIHTQHPFMASL